MDGCRKGTRRNCDAGEHDSTVPDTLAPFVRTDSGNDPAGAAVYAILRNANSHPVNWHFTSPNARIKLERLYPSIQDG